MRYLFFSLLAAAFALPLPAQNISTYVRSNGPGATIQVLASKQASYRIPRTIYGTFWENIGKSIYGGVSAQLLDNPSLETYPASLSTLSRRFSEPQFQHSSYIGLPLPWLPLWKNENRRYEPRWGHAANSHRYLYLMGLPGREVGIRQAVYLPIEGERDYEGVLFASSENGPQTLEVSFRRKDAPDAVLATARVDAPGAPGWQKLAFHLSLPAHAIAPLEPVDFAVSIRGNHRISLDEIRLYPADAVDGLDPDVIRAAKVLHCPLMRYGGNFTSSYHWKNGVGPLDLRPTLLNEAWGIPEYNLVGTDEVMKLCELMGARAQICLNLGSGTAEEARQWVEYCTGSPNTPEGRERAQNGHPAPYPVAAWELGNELWNQDDVGWQTPQGNAERYQEFYNAIHSLVPQDTMIFATGGDIDFYRDWNAALINQDKGELHYMSTHFVVGMDDVADKNAGRDFIWKADLAVPVGVGEALAPMKAQIDANPATRGRVKLAYTEWLFTAPRGSFYPRWTNLGGALVAAGWMNMLLEHADFVPVSDMTGLVEFAGIHKRRGRVFVTPQYWAFWLYSNFAGDTPVATRTTVGEYDVRKGVRRIPDISNVPYLDVLATTDSRRHDLTLFIVNRDWQHDLSTSISLQDFNPAAKVVVRTLTADSILSGNDAVHPQRVRPAKTELRVSGNTLHYILPKHSLTVITLEGR
ncbi:MAG TPA: alpha-L-arabinofuranosidase C-terminal domain-containing protein [Terriglobia bacterium]|nr:alpha-L-arabinofuranosidase C-terminal domain-containing protein [Terriglobia bacterium]